MGLEVALLAVMAASLLGAAASLASHRRKVRASRRRAPPALDRGVPRPKLALRLQPADPGLTVHVLTDATLTAIEVEGVCPRIVVHRAPGPEDPPAPPDVTIGDAAFERAFVVRGDPLLAAALLDADTRRLLLSVAGSARPRTVVVERGVLISATASRSAKREALLRHGREVVDLAQRLVTPAEPVRRLVNVARLDPLPAVRLRAALALGEEGREALLALAGSDGLDDATATGALKALGSSAPLELVLDALRRALGSDPAAAPAQAHAARVCLLALGAFGQPEALSRVRFVLSSVDALVPEAAKVLGRMGGPDAEAALIEGLAHERPERCLAIVPVLARMGTAAAVPALRDCERVGGDLRRAARAAIAEIQVRLTGQPGAVSLAGGEAGQVSLAPDAGGAVSLPPDRPKD